MQGRDRTPRRPRLILLLVPLVSLWGCSEDLPTSQELAPTAEAKPGIGIQSEHEAAEGPQVTGISVDPEAAEPGEEVTLTAVATASEGAILASGEYRLGDGPWTPMAADDGAFDGNVETLVATFPAPEGLSELAVCVRASESGEEEGSEIQGAETCLGGEEEAGVEGFVTGGGWFDNVDDEGEGEEGEGEEGEGEEGEDEEGEGEGEEGEDEEGEGEEGEDESEDRPVRTHFGFVIRHLDGQEHPSGNLNVMVGNGQMHFRAHAFDYLELDAEARSASFGGVGEVEGEEYNFEAHVVDGRPDLFRLRIWAAGGDEEGEGEEGEGEGEEGEGEEGEGEGEEGEADPAALYDSGERTLGGGNITVHLRRVGPPPGVGNGNGPPEGKGPGNAQGKGVGIGSQGQGSGNGGARGGRP
jgi:hypothetical protein